MVIQRSNIRCVALTQLEPGQLAQFDFVFQDDVKMSGWEIYVFPVNPVVTNQTPLMINSSSPYNGVTSVNFSEYGVNFSEYVPVVVGVAMDTHDSLNNGQLILAKNINMQETIDVVSTIAVSAIQELIRKHAWIESGNQRLKDALTDSIEALETRLNTLENP